MKGSNVQNLFDEGYLPPRTKPRVVLRGKRPARMNGDELPKAAQLLRSEMSQRIVGHNAAKDVELRKKVGWWFTEQNIVLNRINKGQQSVYQTMLRVERDKRRFAMDSHKRRQEESRRLSTSYHFERYNMERGASKLSRKSKTRRHSYPKGTDTEFNKYEQTEKRMDSVTPKLEKLNFHKIEPNSMVKYTGIVNRKAETNYMYNQTGTESKEQSPKDLPLLRSSGILTPLQMVTGESNLYRTNDSNGEKVSYCDSETGKEFTTTTHTSSDKESLKHSIAQAKGKVADKQNEISSLKNEGLDDSEKGQELNGKGQGPVINKPTQKPILQSHYENIAVDIATVYKDVNGTGLVGYEENDKSKTPYRTVHLPILTGARMQPVSRKSDTDFNESQADKRRSPISMVRDINSSLADDLLDREQRPFQVNPDSEKILPKKSFPPKIISTPKYKLPPTTQECDSTVVKNSRLEFNKLQIARAEKNLLQTDDQCVVLYRRNSDGNVVPVPEIPFKRKEFKVPDHREEHMRQKLLECQKQADRIQNEKLEKFYEKVDRDGKTFCLQIF